MVLDVQGWIWQFKTLAEDGVVRKTCILSCDVEGFLREPRQARVTKCHNLVGLEPPYMVHLG
jgi:hypothetical protein